MSQPGGIAVYTMTLLRCADRYLMLKRGEHKRFAPGRWTGIGGRVEPDELDDVQTAALREIREETGLDPREIERFTLRRSLLQQRPGHPLTILLYFTGDADRPEAPRCEEGSLHWLTGPDLAGIDIIENTREIIPLLIDDVQQDPAGSRPTVTGAASFSAGGELRSIVWSRQE